MLVEAVSALSVWAQRPAPVMSATQAWEQNAVYEPTVLKSKDGYRMWYTGGWSTTGIGYAESKDGVHWRKRQGPIFTGYSRNNVVKAGGVYYLFMSDNVAGGNLVVATSTDGVSYTQPVVAIPSTGIANSTAVVVNGTWYMLADMRVDGAWRVVYAKGPDPYHLTVGGTVSGLEMGGSYGSAQLSWSNGFTVHYLASTTGDLPTDIYTAQSSDLARWTNVKLELGRDYPWEADQVADPYAVGDKMWFAGCNNPIAYCAIGEAAVTLATLR